MQYFLLRPLIVLEIEHSGNRDFQIDQEALLFILLSPNLKLGCFGSLLKIHPKGTYGCPYCQ
jgi:hypothetical protein